ncbi:unnamed protein product, partial [marine sediment metagenome]
IRETKSAVIGLGFMGKVHCENIRRLPYVKLQAVVEGNEDTLRRYQAMYHTPEAYTDWRDLLKSKGIDVVHNCTPNSLHYPINKAFAERGTAIISEKPLTVNLGEERNALIAAQPNSMGMACARREKYSIYTKIGNLWQKECQRQQHHPNH